MRLAVFIAAATVCAGHSVLAAQQDTMHHAHDTLTRAPVQLEAVTVTATPVKRDEPASTTRIPASVLQRTPAINAYDLLRMAGGLEVHDQGQGPGFASDASLRGFSSDHSTDIALWVDGVPNNEPVNGHAEGYNDWNLLFPGSIETIDLIKGPTSALFGNFAMAGVVNVRTLERMDGVRISASGGSYDRFDGTGLAGFSNDDVHGVVGVRGLHETGWRPNSAYDVGQFHGRVVGDVWPNARIDAGVELYGTNWDSPGFITDSQFNARSFATAVEPTDGGFKRRAQERVSLRVLAGDNAIWRTTAYATQGRWQLFLTVPPEPGSGEGTGSQTEEEDQRYGVGLTSAITFQQGRTEFTLGTEGRWDHSDYENWLTTARHRDSSQALVDARQASGAVFLQSTTDLGHHFRMVLGGRLDALNTESAPVGGTATNAGHAVFSPKIGMLYHIPSVGEIYANVSRGFRQTDGVIGDPTLPFITEWAYETGVKVDVQNLSVSAAAFRMDVSNEQTFDPLTLTSTSGGASRRQGVELGLETRVAPGVSVSGDWTFNDAKYTSYVTADGDTLNDTRVFNTARYVGTAALEVAPVTSLWHLRLSGNVVGPYTPFDLPGVERPAYGLLHASAGMLIGDAMVELGVRNLLDQVYPELAAGGFVSPGQPRSVYLTVQYRL